MEFARGEFWNWNFEILFQDFWGLLLDKVGTGQLIGSNKKDKSKISIGKWALHIWTERNSVHNDLETRTFIVDFHGRSVKGSRHSHWTHWPSPSSISSLYTDSHLVNFYRRALPTTRMFFLFPKFGSESLFLSFVRRLSRFIEIRGSVSGEIF